MTRFQSLQWALAGVAVAGLVVSLTGTPASACGCLSPPVPESVGEFAVNQQSEQIIFEVPGDGTVTAHVLIKYAGAPEKFAWLVPVPSVPQLALSESAAFAVLDSATAPSISIRSANACPDPDYVCDHHPACYDPTTRGGNQAFDTTGTGFADAGSSDTASTPLPGGVEVLQSLQVGEYDTVVFSADEAMGTVQWLRDNGFIVNDTMTPYMQPYLDAGMLFIAAKLIPGAEVSAIRPLKMTYEFARPIIPLQLTAVAAEPHLTVTSYFFSNSAMKPVDQPLVNIDQARISSDAAGRNNYPMVMARSIDEAGGNAFVTEYEASTPIQLPTGDNGSGCCASEDVCGVAGDSLCQCPGKSYDAEDCDATAPGLTESILLLEDLSTRYTTLTRLTTRLSPEEMTFDPQFEAKAEGPLAGRLILQGARTNLNGCLDDVLNRAEHDEIEARTACSSIYCGAGRCMVTDIGAGCRCDAGHVARTFTDLDGLPSVTCQPRQALVDLGADIEIPDACAGVALDNGTCVDVGGFPSADCDITSAGVLTGTTSTPICVPTREVTGSPGAEDFSAPLADLAVCTPAPAACGESGWLVENPSISIQGVSCPGSAPDPSRLVVPHKPSCLGVGDGGACGGATSSSNGGLWLLVLLAGGLLGGLRRRRRNSIAA
ncbi:MAG: hypothetical protein ACI9MR_002163 [Myxococcota bacterium]|jgi:hypothetical protein